MGQIMPRSEVDEAEEILAEMKAINKANAADLAHSHQIHRQVALPIHATALACLAVMLIDDFLLGLRATGAAWGYVCIALNGIAVAVNVYGLLRLRRVDRRAKRFKVIDARMKAIMAQRANLFSVN